MCSSICDIVENANETSQYIQIVDALRDFLVTYRKPVRKIVVGEAVWKALVDQRQQYPLENTHNCVSILGVPVYIANLGEGEFRDRSIEFII